MFDIVNGDRLPSPLGVKVTAQMDDGLSYLTPIVPLNNITELRNVPSHHHRLGHK